MLPKRSLQLLRRLPQTSLLALLKLVFENRSDSDRNDIIDFLEARGGVESFDWTPPFGDAGKYICSEWQTTLRSHNFNNIRAIFQQVYEP